MKSGFSRYLPNAICIGCQRGGTTWLERMMRNHPLVSVAGCEAAYLCSGLRKYGIEAICEKYGFNQTLPIRFEKTPYYSALYSEEVE